MDIFIGLVVLALLGFAAHKMLFKKDDVSVKPPVDNVQPEEPVQVVKAQVQEAPAKAPAKKAKATAKTPAKSGKKAPAKKSKAPKMTVAK